MFQPASQPEALKKLESFYTTCKTDSAPAKHDDIVKGAGQLNKKIQAFQAATGNTLQFTWLQVRDTPVLTGTHTTS